MRDFLILAVAVFAGLIGGLLGLGGGVVLVPALSTFLGVPLTQAVGTSLIAISATSISSTIAYVRQRLTQVELGVGLVAATAVGALAGGFVGLAAGSGVVAVVFFALTIYTAIVLVRRHLRPAAETPRPQAPRPRLAYPLMLVSGALSGLLGIGGGPINVPVLNVLLDLPLRQAVATSSFMVGVTAATGGVLYLATGRLDPLAAGLCVVGVAIGAQVAGALQRHIPTRWLALAFAAVLVAVGAQMAVNHL